MKKKLTLNPDDLAVTSFDPAPAAEAHGLAPTRNTQCETCRTLCLPYC